MNITNLFKDIYSRYSFHYIAISGIVLVLFSVLSFLLTLYFESYAFIFPHFNCASEMLIFMTWSWIIPAFGLTIAFLLIYIYYMLLKKEQVFTNLKINKKFFKNNLINKLLLIFLFILGFLSIGYIIYFLISNIFHFFIVPHFNNGSVLLIFMFFYWIFPTYGLSFLLFLTYIYFMLLNKERTFPEWRINNLLFKNNTMLKILSFCFFVLSFVIIGYYVYVAAKIICLSDLNSFESRLYMNYYSALIYTIILYLLINKFVKSKIS